MTLLVCFISVIVWYFVPETVKVKAVENELQQKNRNGNSDFHPVHFVKFFKQIDLSQLWDLFLVRFLLGFSILVSRNNFTLMLDYKYNVSPAMTGYVISYGSIIATISGFFVGRISNMYQNDATLLHHMALVQSLALLAIGYAPSLWVLVACMTPLSISTAISRVCSTNLTILRGHGQETGALLGLGASILSIARMMAPFLGGVAQEVHVSGPALLGAVCAILATLVLFVVPQDSSNISHKVKVT